MCLKKNTLFNGIELSIDNEIDGEDDAESKKEDFEDNQLLASFTPDFGLVNNSLVFCWSPFQPKIQKTTLNIKTPPPDILS